MGEVAPCTARATTRVDALRRGSRSGAQGTLRARITAAPRSRRMPRASRLDGPEPSCLFPDEKEIARLVLGSSRVRSWPSLAIVLERRGLPRIDPQFGGRYWPKVRAFLDRMQHVEDASLVRVEHEAPSGGKRTGGVRPRP